MNLGPAIDGSNMSSNTCLKYDRLHRHREGAEEQSCSTVTEFPAAPTEMSLSDTLAVVVYLSLKLKIRTLSSDCYSSV